MKQAIKKTVGKGQSSWLSESQTAIKIHIYIIANLTQKCNRQGLEKADKNKGHRVFVDLVIDSNKSAKET